MLLKEFSFFLTLILAFEFSSTNSDFLNDSDGLRINKRGIGSFFKNLIGKKTTETTLGSTTNPTTISSSTVPKTTRPSIYTIKQHEISNDPIYILKNICFNDSSSEFCIIKKYNLSSIVRKCDQIDKYYKVEACKESISIYCYVFIKQDPQTCKSHTYNEYIPGKKSYTTIKQLNNNLTTTATATKVLLTSKSKFDEYYQNLKEKCLKNPSDFYCKARKEDMLSTIEKCKSFTLKSVNNNSCQGLISFYCYVFPNQDSKYCVVANNVTKLVTSVTTTSKTTFKTFTSEVIDPFLSLKTQCDKFMNDECKRRKASIYDLVLKCDGLSTNIANALSACKEIVSVYCYLFSKQDPKTCLTHSHDEYVPNNKPLATTISTTLSTKKQQNPFNRIPGFDGTLKEVPDDKDLLKEIGNYCLSISNATNRDKNCDKLLQLMKNTYKNCEDKPLSDKNCQKFKINLCSAFNKFPGCNKISKNYLI